MMTTLRTGVGLLAVLVLFAPVAFAGDPSPNTDSVWLNNGYPTIAGPDTGSTEWTVTFSGQWKATRAAYQDWKVVVSIRKKNTSGQTQNVVTQKELATSRTSYTPSFDYGEFAGPASFNRESGYTYEYKLWLKAKQVGTTTVSSIATYPLVDGWAPLLLPAETVGGGSNGGN
jgi:hypothetical protein